MLLQEHERDGNTNGTHVQVHCKAAGGCGGEVGWSCEGEEEVWPATLQDASQVRMYSMYYTSSMAWCTYFLQTWNVCTYALRLSLIHACVLLYTCTYTVTLWPRWSRGRLSELSNLMKWQCASVQSPTFQKLHLRAAQLRYILHSLYIEQDRDICLLRGFVF